MGLIDKFEHVLVYDKGKNCNFLSLETSFRCVSVFSCSAVSVFLVFPQKTIHTSSPIVDVAEQEPSRSFKEFLKMFVIMYVVNLKYVFPHLHF